MRAMKAAPLGKSPAGTTPGIYRPMGTTSSPTRQIAQAHIFQKASAPSPAIKLPKY